MFTIDKNTKTQNENVTESWVIVIATCSTWNWHMKKMRPEWN